MCCLLVTSLTYLISLLQFPSFLHHSLFSVSLLFSPHLCFMSLSFASSSLSQFPFCMFYFLPFSSPIWNLQNYVGGRKRRMKEMGDRGNGCEGKIASYRTTGIIALELFYSTVLYFCCMTNPTLTCLDFFTLSKTVTEVIKALPNVMVSAVFPFPFKAIYPAMFAFPVWTARIKCSLNQ